MKPKTFTVLGYKSIVRNSPEHTALALKAAREAKRVLPIFEKVHPNDKRPHLAIAALQDWAQGKRTLGMAEVRTILPK